MVDNSDELLASIRRIIRAVDVHSKDLLKKYGMTGPQLIILREIGTSDMLSVSEIAKNINLSQATVTNILLRLEHQGYITRSRGEIDKRKVYVKASEKTLEILASKPSLLQIEFVNRFKRLKDWEKSLLISSLQRIAAMMNAGDLEAAPHLFSDQLYVEGKREKDLANLQE